MADTPTVTAIVKIDVSPNGIRFMIESLENDLASLIFAAGDFVVDPLVYHTHDTSDVTIRTKKVLQFIDPPEPPPDTPPVE